jgi:serine protease Do
MRRILVPLAAAGLLLVPATAGAGARVRSVRADSPAARAGVQPGDEILVAGGRDVRDADDLSTALQAPGRKSIAVRRDGGIKVFMLGE